MIGFAAGINVTTPMAVPMIKIPNWVARNLSSAVRVDSRVNSLADGRDRNRMKRGKRNSIKASKVNNAAHAQAQ